MKYPRITRLYKYYACNKYSRSMLRNRAFWFAKPDALNDPFDCKVPFDHRINIEDLRRFLPRYRRYRGKKQAENDIQNIIDANGIVKPEFAKIWSNVLKRANEDLSNWGVFCLSECNDSILMWSHYTNNHKGFCIEFARSPQNELGDYDRTRKVKYRFQYPFITPLDPKAYDLRFYRKAAAWKYEKEWRLLNKPGNIAAPLSADISAIIFGLNITKRNKQIIRTMMPDVKYCQCRIALNQFGIKIVDL